jgi:hypothetical protein
MKHTEMKGNTVDKMSFQNKVQLVEVIVIPDQLIMVTSSQLGQMEIIESISQSLQTVGAIFAGFAILYLELIWVSGGMVATGLLVHFAGASIIQKWKKNPPKYCVIGDKDDFKAQTSAP